jgi:tRNA dimethylallyltransferase
MPRRDHVLPTVVIGLAVDRPLLDERIAQRVHEMWASGLVAEVESLLPQGLREGRTASKALGYSQVIAMLKGQTSAEEAQTATAVATRRYARRQDSWFRADPRVVWLPFDARDLPDQALAVVTAAAARMTT